MTVCITYSLHNQSVAGSLVSTSRMTVKPLFQVISYIATNALLVSCTLRSKHKI